MNTLSLHGNIANFMQLFARTSDASLIVKNGVFIDCNMAALVLFGYPSKSALLNHSPEDSSPEFQPDGQRSAEKVQEMTTLAFQKGLHHFEWERIRYDGTSIILDVSLTAIMLEGEKCLHVLWRDRLGKISKKQIDSMQQFIKNMGDAHLVFKDGVYIECNQAAVDLLGYPDKKTLFKEKPRHFYPTFQPDGRNSVETILKYTNQVHLEGSSTFEWTYKKYDDSLINVTAMVTFAIVDGEEILHVVLRDLTPQLEAQSDSIKQLLRKIGSATLLVKEDKFVDCNQAAAEILGYPNPELLQSMHPADISPLIQPDGTSSKERSNELMKKAYYESCNYFEWTHLKYDGTPIILEVLLTPVSINNEQMIHVIWRDLTEAKKQENVLKNLAHYDSLTGLPNRVLFADRFDQATSHSARTKTQLAVCFLDIDNFKPVNDRFGHNIGDQLLIKIANRISRCIRDEDTVSRIGGDEFTLLLRDFETPVACEQLVKRILYHLNKPYHIEGQFVSITASCGITMYSPSNKIIDIDSLIRQADHAMYEAKSTGKNKLAFFDAETEYSSKQHLKFLDRVSKAILSDEFVLHYQPKINMRTGKMFGAEALIRWQHPDKGLLSPFNFLPKIEKSTVMIDIGNWVIEQALIQLEHWGKEGKHWVVSINIDAHHFTQANFVNDLKQALDKHPTVPAELLEIEILETVSIDNLEQVNELIYQCQTLGVSFALDDFGTGYSSLSYLKSLPVEWVKIDQSFVRDMLEDGQDLAIIDAIITLSKAFKREIIAEGVETIEHGIALLELACENAQGYGIAKPMPAKNIIAWEDNYQSPKVWTDYS